MDLIKIKCYECQYSKLINKNIICKKKELPPEIWSEILNYYTLYKCDLCNNKICVEHLDKTVNNCNYYKCHQKKFLNSKYICDFCFFDNI